MSNEKRYSRSNKHPEAKDVYMPVSLKLGERDIVVGKGSLKGGQLVIKFKDSFPAVAIQRTIARGALIGVELSMLAEDALNKETQLDMLGEAQMAAIQEVVKEVVDSGIPIDIKEESDPEYNVPVNFGEPGTEGRPHIGWAKVDEFGQATIKFSKNAQNYLDEDANPDTYETMFHNFSLYIVNNSQEKI